MTNTTSKRGPAQLPQFKPIDGAPCSTRPADLPMNRRHFLAAGTILGAVWARGTAPVVAGETVDPRFPATIVVDFGGKSVRLALTGVALRSKIRVRIYTVASYIQEGVAIPSPEGLATLDVPKQLHLIFERGVDGATMAKAFRESIGRSYPAPAFADELAMLEQHFVANPVKQGDRVLLTQHLAGRKHTAIAKMSWVVRDVMAVLDGQSPRYPAP